MTRRWSLTIDEGTFALLTDGERVAVKTPTATMVTTSIDDCLRLLPLRVLLALSVDMRVALGPS